MKITTTKIKASALQYTLFVAVIVMILVSSVVMLTYLQNRLRISKNQKIDDIKSIYKTFEYISKVELSYNEPKAINMSLSEGEYEFIATKKHWGIYDIIESKSVKNIKTALMGGHIGNRPALYMADKGKGLVLVGDTNIKGSDFLPEYGVKRGNIAGN